MELPSVYAGVRQDGRENTEDNITDSYKRSSDKVHSDQDSQPHAHSGLITSGQVRIKIMLQMKPRGTATLHHVHLPVHTPVSLLKQSLETELSLLPDRQRWSFHNSELQDTDTLSSHKVRHDDHIQVIMSPLAQEETPHTNCTKDRIGPPHYHTNENTRSPNMCNQEITESLNICTKESFETGKMA